MERRPWALEKREYDLLVIGGGIFGASAAWEAAERGLSVALLERGDFGEATSTNYFRVAHGGIRYLQHGDVRRLWESSGERSNLLRIAPHLVYPLPILIPAAGRGMRGKTVLRLGFRLYDLLTVRRNRGLLPDRRIPRTRGLSRKEVEATIPALRQEGLTGGAVFFDGQIYNMGRLVLSFLGSASSGGAEIANYLEVTKLLHSDGKVRGAVAVDRLDGSERTIRANLVLNASGPWAVRQVGEWLDLKLADRSPSFSRDVALVTDRPAPAMGIGCPTESRDADALIDRGGRHLFWLPWRERTIVGVWHREYAGSADLIEVDDAEIRGWVDEVNRAFPGFDLHPGEVSLVNAGLILYGEDIHEARAHSFGKHSLLIDHGVDDGMEGLISLIGVRATMARGEAEKAIDLALSKLGLPRQRSGTASTPLTGGGFESFERLVAQIASCAHDLPSAACRSVAHNHGSTYRELLDRCDEDPRLAEPIADTAVLKAEVVHAAHSEMAQTLSDVVLRRTDLGNAGDPGESALSECASVLAGELGWSEERRKTELEYMRGFFRCKGARHRYGRPRIIGVAAG